MFGSCGTTFGGALGASGRIRVCLGCVTRTGIERMVCLAREASAPGLSGTLGAIVFGFSWGAGTGAGNEIRGRSGCSPDHVNSICTGASVGVCSGKKPQMGRIKSQITATCHKDDAVKALPGTLPLIQST